MEDNTRTAVDKAFADFLDARLKANPGLGHPEAVRELYHAFMSGYIASIADATIRRAAGSAPLA